MGPQRPFDLTAPSSFHVFSRIVSSSQQALGEAGARGWVRLWKEQQWRLHPGAVGVPRHLSHKG